MAGRTDIIILRTEFGLANGANVPMSCHFVPPNLVYTVCACPMFWAPIHNK